MLNRNSKVLFLVLTFVFLCSTLAAIYAYDKTYTVYMAGNSHIDTAWQWTTSTTRSQYVPNTFTNAINMMNANPDFTFNASAALHYYWMQQDNPTLFNNIKTKVANGQWAIVGGEWIEADTNITGGESLIRQHLYGQRYFNQNFNQYCTVGWLPDCFGFTAQLPQILHGCGMDYFMTTKLNWNDTTAFPYEIYKWQGIDGTQIIVDKPRSDYSVGVDINNINYTLDEPNRHGIKKGLVVWGSGDSGGGPTQSQITSIKSLDASSSNPNIKMYSANKFFGDLTATDKANITDVWTGYMPLENHRGTYTSQALIKKNNRVGEVLAEEAEKFSSIAQWLGAKDYDSSNIWSAWQLLMLNQFHDILPGSGTNNQVTEAHTNGTNAINTLNSVLNSAVSAIAGQATTTVSSGVPIVVFNPLSFGRKFPVQTSVTFSAAPTSLKVFDSGTEIPCQILSTSGNTATIVFVVDNVPSIGYKVVQAVANTGNYSGASVMSIASNVITSDKFQVTIGSNGNISAILDKTNNRQVLTGDGNVLQILTDTPAQYDAWNVDYAQMTAAPLATLNSASAIKIIENGPAKCTYEVDKSYGSSTFQQFITLYPGIDKVDIRMTANWNESHKMLKVMFPWNVSGATSVMYDVAYGAVSRPNTMTQGMFEVPAHKWADLSANNYGVSLLNNCKYGYDCNGSTMRLSLLRSPKSPDGSCDMGTVPDFTYSIYPHTGDWKSANTMNKGWELNAPLIAYPTTSHSGTLGASYSFFAVNAANIILTVVKKAEDSSDYILRMYETQGSSANPTITVPGTITSISETDMLERNIGTPSYSTNTFSTSLSAYKIKTFKVNFGGIVPTPTVTPTITPTATPTPSSQNIALNKTATANQNVTGEDPFKAVDGTVLNNSKWCSNVSGDKWLMLDLGQTYTINRWVVQHAGAGGENTAWNTSDFKLQTSTDGNTWVDYDLVTGNTANITDRTITSISTRYVRLYITKPTNNTDIAARIYEFELYNSGGTPTPTNTVTPTPTLTSTPTPTSGALKVNLTSSFNQDGFSYDTNRTNGNYDGGGANYSADLINTAPTFESQSYQLGPMTDGSNNAIKGTGQTITLSQGTYTTIRFLGSATQGDQTGTFQINYTDGTNSTISVTEKDWCTSSTSGQKIVQTMSQRHNGSTDQSINTYVFAYYLSPTVGKTVASLIIPNNANIHILAITLVP